MDPKESIKAKDGQKRDFPNGIPECGADALRFTLCAYTSTGRDVNLDILRIEGYRKFCNKLWNATRFVLMKLDPSFTPLPLNHTTPLELSLFDRWILEKLHHAAASTNAALSDFNFMAATTAVHHFWLYELCDVYIEVVKPLLSLSDENLIDSSTPTSIETSNHAARLAAQNTLYTCLDQGLKLLHPFMPFVTEELYQRLPRRPDDTIPSIMLTSYPELNDPRVDSSVDSSVANILSIVKAARSLLSDYNILSGAKCLCHFAL